MLQSLLAGATKLMEGFEEMVNADSEATSAGLTFVDADFAGTALKHLDAATLTAARTKLGIIRTWMTTNRDAFDKVRP